MGQSRQRPRKSLNSPSHHARNDPSITEFHPSRRIHSKALAGISATYLLHSALPNARLPKPASFTVGLRQYALPRCPCLLARRSMKQGRDLGRFRAAESRITESPKSRVIRASPRFGRFDRWPGFHPLPHTSHGAATRSQPHALPWQSHGLWQYPRLLGPAYSFIPASWITRRQPHPRQKRPIMHVRIIPGGHMQRIPDTLRPVICDHRLS